MNLIDPKFTHLPQTDHYKLYVQPEVYHSYYARDAGPWELRHGNTLVFQYYSSEEYAGFGIRKETP
jgi:hypothetical protein